MQSSLSLHCFSVQMASLMPRKRWEPPPKVQRKQHRTWQRKKARKCLWISLLTQKRSRPLRTAVSRSRRSRPQPLKKLKMLWKKMPIRHRMMRRPQRKQRKRRLMKKRLMKRLLMQRLLKLRPRRKRKKRQLQTLRPMQLPRHPLLQQQRKSLNPVSFPIKGEATL